MTAGTGSVIVQSPISILHRACSAQQGGMINAAAAVLLLDCGRFVPMHFPGRNDHTVNVRSRQRTCGRVVPGTKLPSNFRALERITECRKGVTIYM